MGDLISRQALLNKFEPWLKVKDYSDGELNMLKAILYEIRFMPSATDKNVGTKLGTDLAEVGTDCISRQAAIDIAKELTITLDGYEMSNQAVMNYCAEIMQLPPIQPKRGKWIRDGHHIRCDQCGMYMCDTDRE